jgi:hypothetical protein
MKLKCPVIEDLLPLYTDGVCSKESRIIVEEHLAECDLCSDKFRVQKSEIIVGDNVIKENLKSKEPFKRIKKFQMIRLMVILITIPILILSFMEVRGDGIGFSTLYGRYKTERFLSYVEKGNFAIATRYMAFSGGKYEKVENEDAKKQEWITGMQELKNHGISIISHRQNGIITDDAFTSGYVIVSATYEDKTYDFRLFISTDSGNVEPGNLSIDVNSQSKKPTEVEIILIEKISNVISTYNPG